MKEIAGNVPSAFFKVVVAALVLASGIITVHSRGISDFISIDCGSTTSYIDDTTGITYVPDSGYIDSGVSKGIATQYKTNVLEKHFQNVRSFPDGDRNCYTLKPNQVPDTKYLIRARFMYGNYDSKGQAPEFELYIGGNLWDTVRFVKQNQIFTAEIVHYSPSTVTYVCLVNKGEGTPFISVLELRLIDRKMYNSTYDTMTLSDRLDLGSNYEYRYGDDDYDRIWTGVDWSDTMKTLSTSQTVKNTESSFAQPSIVMQTALTPIDPSVPLAFSVTSNATTKNYLYLHFAEVESLKKTDLRQFKIYLNGRSYSAELETLFLSSFCFYNSEDPLTGSTSYNFTLEKTSISTHPPILNAIELYLATDMSQLETDSGDVGAVNNIKSAYSLIGIWQGDPCTPRDYMWKGLNCSFTLNKAPRIISLNLSSSNLKGVISAYIYDLKLLQKLDLSNNSLVGTVPAFLSTMTSLTYINLKGNNLNGIVPADLLAKSKQGTLTLILDNNPNLCLSAPCSTPSGKKSSLLIPIIAAVVGIIILVLVVLIFVLCKVKRKNPKTENNAQTREAAVVVVTEGVPRSKVSVTEPVSASMPAQNERIQTKNQCFTASEVSNMTNNFSKVIGEGGFGTVYLGVKDDVQVAVKILSASSTQGYKEFKAEAELLMTVHHRNLTSLIGYCDDGGILGLVYEYMANGNLGSHIADKNPEYLSWEGRLHVALDSAQGLEYLHHGCRDPIVHRDIKPANILLNEKFEAKIADFGLSRAFAADNNLSGILPTVVAGTPGYLDPEYFQIQQLNEKSDVFSFGIVLLEIITSRPVMCTLPERMHISVWVNQVLSNQGDIKAIIDKRLLGEYDTNSAWKAVEVAMSCVSQTSDKRPSMNEVVSELSQCLSMEKARKKGGFSTDTFDSVEMVSFGLNNAYIPSAR